MSKRNVKSAPIGKTKRSTDAIIDDAIARQNSWMERRRAFAKKFLKRLNIFAKPALVKESGIRNQESVKKETVKSEKTNGLSAYWFPILCALLVIFIAIWVVFVRSSVQKVVVVPVVPEPIVQVVNESANPTFDIVRIEKDGNVIIAGRWLPNQNVSIIINKKIVATEYTNSRGEFVYAPTRAFAPGNYTIRLVAAESDVKSEDSVFLYVSEYGVQNSVSLLITKDGSTLMQSPAKLVDGDLAVSKIDYLENGRIVVTGDALPKLRVSLALNDKYLGWTRVSDHKHYGLGADVDQLEPGKEYRIDIRLHDGDGKTVGQVTHRFVMPEMTGDDDTFYTVRRGDCLWIIARNFLRRGVLFSIIAERNNIENPDLIFPKQILQIPIEKN